MADDCPGVNPVTVCAEENLRAAISAGGLVSFCCDGTIVLTNEIDITRDVALDARGRAVVISGGNEVRLFKVSPGVRFSVTNLTLADGRHKGKDGTNGIYQLATQVSSPGEAGLPGQGGAIFNDGGIVELAFSTLTNNRAIGGQGGRNSGFNEGAAGGAGAGGAIFSLNGSVLLVGVTMSSNVASGGSGGIVQFGPWLSGDGLGGAVFSSNSHVMVVNCVLNSNACTTVPSGHFGPGPAARGGALFQWSGSLSISNSILHANEAASGDTPQIGLGGWDVPGSAHGGAIAASNGMLRIDRSRLVSNLARGGNGYKYSGSGEAQGGAVFSEATLLAFDTSFDGNQALSGSGGAPTRDGRGGAIHNSGFARLDGCTVYSNVAIGGGFYSFQTDEFSGGHAMGGGIFNSGQLAATNCTVSLNCATGGLANLDSGNGLGGGIYNDADSLFAGMNMTVSSNSVLAGTAVYDWGEPGTAAGANIANITNGTFTLKNSILSTGSTNGNALGSITDEGFNMSSDGTANFTSGTSLNFTDPLLGPLTDYGGPTLTMALRPNSPAIDFGGSEDAPSTDQRGFSRPFGGGVDIGAYEFHSNQTEVPRLNIAQAESGVVVMFEAIPETKFLLQSSSTFAAWADLESYGPFVDSTTVSQTIETDDASFRFFRLVIPSP